MLQSETHGTGTKLRKSPWGTSVSAQAFPPGTLFPQDLNSLWVGSWVLMESWVFLLKKTMVLYLKVGVPTPFHCPHSNAKPNLRIGVHFVNGSPEIHACYRDYSGVKEAWWRPQIPQRPWNLMGFSIPLLLSQQRAFSNLADPCSTSACLADIPASFKSCTEHACGGLHSQGDRSALLELLLREEIPEP